MKYFKVLPFLFIVINLSAQDVEMQSYSFGEGLKFTTALIKASDAKIKFQVNQT